MATAEISLLLSQDEANVLAAILHRVGGLPNGTRGKADAIQCALESVNVFPEHGFDMDGTIFFRDGTPNVH